MEASSLTTLCGLVCYFGLSYGFRVEAAEDSKSNIISTTVNVYGKRQNGTVMLGFTTPFHVKDHSAI